MPDRDSTAEGSVDVFTRVSMSRAMRSGVGGVERQGGRRELPRADDDPGNAVFTHRAVNHELQPNARQRCGPYADNDPAFSKK